MGKTDFYLYGLRGKVGNLVGRKARKGGTVLSARSFTVKNPQTNKQMAQRIILSTVAQATKFLTPIIDHSFQGVAIGADSKNRFKSLNMARLRSLAAVDFQDVPKPSDSTVFMTTRRVQALIPNAYIISTGSLSPSKLVIDPQDQGGTQTLMAVKFPDVNLNLHNTTEDGNYVTLGEVLKAYFGITTVSEQLTFVAIQRAGDGYQYAYAGQPDYPGFMIPYTSMRAVRLFIDPTVDLQQKIAIPENSVTALENIQDAIINAFAVSSRTDTDLLYAIKERFDALDGELEVDDGVVEIDNSSNAFDFTSYNMDANDGNGYVYALGLIRSRLKEDGTWDYSNTTMKLARPTSVEETNFGLYWNGAIQAWFETNEVASDELYLQGGTNQNEIGESFT